MPFRRFFVFSIMTALTTAVSPGIAVAGVSVEALARLGGSPEGFSPQAALIAALVLGPKSSRQAISAAPA